MPGWVIPLIVFAAVLCCLILAVLIGFIILKKRKKQSNNDSRMVSMDTSRTQYDDTPMPVTPGQSAMFPQESDRSGYVGANSPSRSQSMYQSAELNRSGNSGYGTLEMSGTGNSNVEPENYRQLPNYHSLGEERFDKYKY